MPLKISTLPCQVDGLKEIYACDKSVCFEFENAKQLHKAKKKVARIYHIEPPFKLPPTSKKPIFAFNVSANPATITINNPIDQFTLNVANTMSTKTDIKNIPFVKYL